MAKSKANERLGETFVNKMGSMFFIKEYYGSNDEKYIQLMLTVKKGT